ncbi:MAG: hypothetical protein PHI19_04855 [Clostridia bacterium]|nr:hypothetical protein [Clostridia bacterium]
MKIKKLIAFITVAALVLSCLFVFTACDKTPEDDGRTLVENDIFYSIDNINSTVKGFSLFFIDPETSGVILRKDGTATFRLQIFEGLSVLSQYLDGMGGTDMGIVLNMIYEYLPGLDLTDLDKTLEVFEGGLSLKLLNVDPEDAELQAMFTHMGETGCLPDNIVIPDGFGLEINTTYYIKDIVSPYDGTTYTGIFMGNHHEDGEAFLMMDLTTEEETNEPKIIMDYELMDIKIVAYPA